MLAPSSDTQALKEALEAAHAAVRSIRSVEVKAGFLGSLAVAHARAADGEGARVRFEEAMEVAGTANLGLQQATAYARIADAVADRGLALAD